MCDKCDNSVIMKINEIIVLLNILSHLYPFYPNQRVGHHALLASCHVMTLFYALPTFYSRYNKASLITLLLQTENKVKNCTNHAIKYFLSGVLRQKEHTLFHIMHYYDTIIATIDLIHIITCILVWQSACGKMA